MSDVHDGHHATLATTSHDMLTYAIEEPRVALYSHCHLFLPLRSTNEDHDPVAQHELAQLPGLEHAQS